MKLNESFFGLFKKITVGVMMLILCLPQKVMHQLKGLIAHLSTAIHLSADSRSLWTRGIYTSRPQDAQNLDTSSCIPCFIPWDHHTWIKHSWAQYKIQKKNYDSNMSWTKLFLTLDIVRINHGQFIYHVLSLPFSVQLTPATLVLTPCFVFWELFYQSSQFSTKRRTEECLHICFPCI